MNNSNSRQQLLTVGQVNDLISKGYKLLLAGSEQVLSQVIQGDWVGGTIPYFISASGGEKSHQLILATLLPVEIKAIKIVSYDAQSISEMPINYFENGFSFVIVPAFSESHVEFSKNSSTWKNVFNQPLIGWISGVDLDMKDAVPKAYNGQKKSESIKNAIVMHIELPPELIARADIINLFQQGQGETIQFLKKGFEADRCLINGVETNVYDYIMKNKIDIQLPLVANYLGAMINVSIREMDHQKKSVQFYAPLFEGVEYKFAEKLKNKYEDEFNLALKTNNVKPIFACNCILNYLYANLQSKKTNITCAMTFGEIAYMLLNQTMVYLSIEKK